jgi:hypothetical protein
MLASIPASRLNHTPPDSDILNDSQQPHPALGDTWQPLGIKKKWPLPYARGMAVKADDPSVLFAGCGETTTGEKGHVLRTKNFGESWEVLPFPTPPNATMWGLATHP